MGVAFAAERRLLAEDELGPVQQSHYPDLAELSHPQLVDLVRFLRARRDRARDLIGDLRRARRGKAGSGGGLSSERGLAAKKQAYARALKRVNTRIAQLVSEMKRQRALAAMRAALDRRRAADAEPSWRVHGRDDGHSGMASRPTRRPRPAVRGSRIGSVSQAGRVAQAIRDNR